MCMCCIPAVLYVYIDMYVYVCVCVAYLLYCVCTHYLSIPFVSLHNAVVVMTPPTVVCVCV